MPKLIKNWKELSEVPANNKYKLDIDIGMGSGWIRPVIETPDTEKDYFNHHYYLSTHTFYGLNYKHSAEVLQKFGFDIELENWDKEGDIDV